VVFTTPSHHCPTSVTMPLERRQALLEMASRKDFLIVEDDYEFEMSFLNPPAPALKSLDEEGRVIYVGSFSKSLFPGLRLGYMVGSETFIREARALRMVVVRHPPGHLQRTVANFLSLGHFDALVARMGQTYRRRRDVMQEAIDRRGLHVAGSDVSGGSSFWMKTPDGIDARDTCPGGQAKGSAARAGSFLLREPRGRPAQFPYRLFLDRQRQDSGRDRYHRRHDRGVRRSREKGHRLGVAFGMVSNRCGSKAQTALLRAHVVAVDAGDNDRLLHGVAAERLAQFLIEQHLDEGGFAILHLPFDRLGQFLGQALLVPDHTPLAPQASAIFA
jgi:hypothetical protein